MENSPRRCVVKRWMSMYFLELIKHLVSPVPMPVLNKAEFRVPLDIWEVGELAKFPLQRGRGFQLSPLCGASVRSSAMVKFTYTSPAHFSSAPQHWQTPRMWVSTRDSWQTWIRDSANIQLMTCARAPKWYTARLTLGISDFCTCDVRV